MDRRRVLISAAAASAVLAAAGVGVHQWTPGWQQGRFSTPARELLAAVALSVVEGLLPTDDNERERAIDAHLQRLTLMVTGLAPSTQSELSDLLAVLCLPPGRWALAGLARPWREASPQEVDAALQSMRSAELVPRIQTYQALRELTMAAHFSSPQAWVVLGYPGPQPI